jgi:hypothetical protein
MKNKINSRVKRSSLQLTAGVFRLALFCLEHNFFQVYIPPSMLLFKHIFTITN